MPEIHYGMLNGMMCLFFFRGFWLINRIFRKKKRGCIDFSDATPLRLLVLFLLAVEFQHTVFDFLAVAENFEDV